MCCHRRLFGVPPATLLLGLGLLFVALAVILLVAGRVLAGAVLLVAGLFLLSGFPQSRAGRGRAESRAEPCARSTACALEPARGSTRSRFARRLAGSSVSWIPTSSSSGSRASRPCRRSARPPIGRTPTTSPGFAPSSRPPTRRSRRRRRSGDRWRPRSRSRWPRRTLRPRHRTGRARRAADRILARRPEVEPAADQALLVALDREAGGLERGGVLLSREERSLVMLAEPLGAGSRDARGSESP